MKVRNKLTGDVLDLDAILKSLISDNFEIFHEPPPPDRWRDVTGECMLTPCLHVGVGSDSGVGNILELPDGRLDAHHENVCIPNGYRLRKVQLYEPLLRGEPTNQAVVRWAFLVERKCEP